MCAPPSTYRTHQSCPTAFRLTWHVLLGVANPRYHMPLPRMLTLVSSGMPSVLSFPSTVDPVQSCFRLLLSLRTDCRFTPLVVETSRYQSPRRTGSRVAHIIVFNSARQSPTPRKNYLTRVKPRGFNPRKTSTFFAFQHLALCVGITCSIAVIHNQRYQDSIC